MSRQRSRLIKRATKLVTFAVVFFGYLSFIGQPLVYLTQVGLWPWLLELLKPTNAIYPGVPFSGYLFLAIGLILFLTSLAWLRVLSDYIAHSRSPISILETHLKVEMLDIAMTRARVDRHQTYHANRDVRAYHFELKCTTPGGEIENGSFTIQSVLNGKEVTDHNELAQLTVPHGRTGLDVTEPYNINLPTNLFATFLPNSVVLFTKSLFARYIVERNSSIVYVNEFNATHAKVQLTSVRYPVTNVVFTLRFFKVTAPQRRDLHCHVLRDNIADRIDAVIREDNDTYITYVFNIGRLYQESVRVHWANSRLELFQQIQSNAAMPA